MTLPLVFAVLPLGDCPEVGFEAWFEPVVPDALPPPLLVEFAPLPEPSPPLEDILWRFALCYLLHRQCLRMFNSRFDFNSHFLILDIKQVESNEQWSMSCRRL